jgi:geranylgeranyl diphosphate synthase type II
MGALVAGARPALLTRLTRYGAAVGLAFQIADDVIDAAAAGDGRTDQRLAKATYPAVVGVVRARRHAARARDAALAAIRPLGPKAEPLRAIAIHVVTRMEAGGP